MRGAARRLYEIRAATIVWESLIAQPPGFSKRGAAKRLYDLVAKVRLLAH
jgi:hypothetical protein